MLLVETLVVLLLIIPAFVRPRFACGWFRKIECGCCRLAVNRTATVLLVGMLAVVLRLAVLPILPIPAPGYPDEFGYLLAGDTFAHGRLTNPTPPMWMHIENACIILKPTYMSKYPPGQGIFLGAGQLLFGHPFWGVCLSIGIMCAAICWMLQGWVPAPWALAGGILAALRLGMFSYWGNSYWGGAVAATGGALVIGALPRIKAQLQLRQLLPMGLGFLILANSRPFEGLVLSLATITFLFTWAVRLHESDFRRTIRTVFGFLTVCCALVFLVVGYYCWRVTGNPLLSPYQVAQNDYYPTPLFLWQGLRPMPHYDDPAIRNNFETLEVPLFLSEKAHPVITFVSKAVPFWLFFFGPALTFPFLLLGLVLPHDFSFRDVSPAARQLIFLGFISFVAAAVTVRFNPGYAAPATAAFYALIVKAMQRVRSWTSNPKVGVALSRAIATTCVALVLLRAIAGPLHISVTGARTWYSVDFQLTERTMLLSQLSRLPGKQLVLVRYPERVPSNGVEWVFNEADLAKSKVVWARDLGSEKNRELTTYFADRNPWLLSVGAASLSLSPYQAGKDVMKAQFEDNP